MSRLVAVSLAGLVLFAWSDARADRRSFTRTYEYMTMPKGGLELEFYNTQETGFGDSDPSALKTQVEVEYGITDRWDLSIYQVFKQAKDPTDPAGNKAFEYAETKLRTRYRLGERGGWPVDVLLYFELVKAFGATEYEVEPKLILARDFGKVTLAVNLIGALVLVKGADPEFEKAYAAGLTYEVVPALKLGAEAFGDFETDGGKRYLGPSFSWGPSPAMWVAVNAGFGLTDAARDIAVQAIIGLGIK